MEHNEKETVAFIGLGHAGWNMAENVFKGGYPLIAGDIDRERERRFCAEHPGVQPASETGYSQASVVVTSLPNGHVVREALVDSGLVATLAPGTIIVDMSSAAPAGTLVLGEELEKLGLILIDAPVSMPTLTGAWSRGLTLMVGDNDEAALDRVQPILDSMSENVFRVGPLGAGHALKTLNNFVGAAGWVAALDALVIGARYGLDPSTMLDVFNKSTARNFATASPLKQEALTRNFASGFQIGLMVKDAGIANDLIDQLDLEAPLARLVRELLQEALDDLGFEADSTETLKYWEKKSGVTVPTPSG